MTAKLAHIDSKQNKLKAQGVDKGKQAQAIMLLGMSWILSTDYSRIPICLFSKINFGSYS